MGLEKIGFLMRYHEVFDVMGTENFENLQSEKCQVEMIFNVSSGILEKTPEIDQFLYLS